MHFTRISVTSFSFIEYRMSVPAKCQQRFSRRLPNERHCFTTAERKSLLSNAKRNALLRRKERCALASLDNGPSFPISKRCYQSCGKARTACRHSIATNVEDKLLDSRHSPSSLDLWKPGRDTHHTTMTLCDSFIFLSTVLTLQAILWLWTILFRTRGI